MTGNPTTLEQLQLRLFLFSLAQVRFGIDMEQIADMVACTNYDDGNLHWSHDLLGFKEGAVQYRTPTVLAIRNDSDRPWLVVIDQPEEMLECPIRAIAPLPPLVEPAALRRGVWGVTLHNDRMVLLVDFQRLARGRGTVADIPLRELLSSTTA